MDALADLKARALKAREFTHRIGECEFTIRVHTRVEVPQAIHNLGLRITGRVSDWSAQVVLDDHLLHQGIVGWTGVRVRDLLPTVADAPDAMSPVPWAPDAVRLLLDAQPKWSTELQERLDAEYGQRATAIEEDAKNSQRTSPAAAAACASSPEASA